jgi:hypothetical protein
MLAESVNESYRMRAAYHAVNGGEDAAFDTEPLEFVDPIDREHRARFRAANAEKQAQSQSNFEAELGFS